MTACFTPLLALVAVLAVAETAALVVAVVSVVVLLELGLQTKAKTVVSVVEAITTHRSAFLAVAEVEPVERAGQETLLAAAATELLAVAALVFHLRLLAPL
jgi:hypothetical protein